MIKHKINGILLVDKPLHLTSNGLVQQVKRLYQAEKVGHTGALDPLATGMLPICLGEATKFSTYWLEANKAYQASGRLGVQTSTADTGGEVIATVTDFNITKANLEAVLNQFLGLTYQIPSMFSAIKHQGRPLYKLARKGLEVPREPRQITIHALNLLAFDGRDFTLQIDCSKGTYIRNLVEDIGTRLGVHAHVTALRRLHTAGLTEETLLSLETIQQKSVAERLALLLPVDKPIEMFPRGTVDLPTIVALQQGKQVPTFLEDTPYLRLYGEEDQAFYGLVSVNDGLIKARRMLSHQL